MSYGDDLRMLRDALDNVSHGALPTWYEPTTLLGADAVACAQGVVKRLYESWSKETIARDEATRLCRIEADAYAHADILTRRTQALEAEVERLAAENKRLRARVGTPAPTTSGGE